MRHVALIAALFFCAGASLAWAHGKATGIVRERMDQMVVLKDTMKQLKPELSKGDGYDAPVVLEGAKTIQAHSGPALTIKFPKGSLTKHSEALPSVWDDPERFAELARQMQVYADQLTASVEAGIPNVAASSGLLGWLREDSDNQNSVDLKSPIDTFGMIANTCRACHDDFRKR